MDDYVIADVDQSMAITEPNLAELKTVSRSFKCRQSWFLGLVSEGRSLFYCQCKKYPFSQRTSHMRDEAVHGAETVSRPMLTSLDSLGLGSMKEVEKW